MPYVTLLLHLLHAGCHTIEPACWLEAQMTLLMQGTPSHALQPLQHLCSEHDHPDLSSCLWASD